MLLQRKILHTSNQIPLVILEKHDLGLEKELLENAKHELLEKAKANNSTLWGYYPALGNLPKEFPACSELAKRLAASFSNDDSLQVAFVRAGHYMSDKETSGFHADGHVDGRPIKDPNLKESEAVLRVLINVSDVSRKLHYCTHTMEELEKMGVKTEYEGYRKVLLPDNIKPAEVFLPPIEENAFWTLKFLASVVPHTGVDDKHGHFLVALGKNVEIKSYRG